MSRTVTTADTTLPVVADDTVYLDANNVAAGAYILRQVLPAGDTQTTPSGGVGFHITVTAGKTSIGNNFVDTTPKPNIMTAHTASLFNAIPIASPDFDALFLASL